jgi:hypothetical protein
MVFGLVAKRSRLVAFVPTDEPKLEKKRQKLLWASIVGLVIMLSFTALIP